MVKNVNGLSLELLVHPGETIKEIIENNGFSKELIRKYIKELPIL